MGPDHTPIEMGSSDKTFFLKDTDFGIPAGLIGKVKIQEFSIKGFKSVFFL
jgi:hypothetical protein